VSIDAFAQHAGATLKPREILDSDFTLWHVGYLACGNSL
jgi:hypothetical protein